MIDIKEKNNWFISKKGIILITFLICICLVLFIKHFLINDNSNDFSTKQRYSIALFVDDIEVQSLDSDKYYDLLSYTCPNGETASWNIIESGLNIYPIASATKWKLYFEEKTTIIVTFNANGGTSSSESDTFVIGLNYGSLPTVQKMAMCLLGGILAAVVEH